MGARTSSKCAKRGKGHNLSVPEMRSWHDCGCCACYTRAADARGLNSPSCVQSVHRIHLTKNSEVVLVEDLVYPRGNRDYWLLRVPSILLGRSILLHIQLFYLQKAYVSMAHSRAGCFALTAY